MKTYLTTKIAFAVSLIFSLAASTAMADADKQNNKVVLMQHDTGWIITINPDGSGSLNFGSNLLDSATFPVGTIDYDRFTKSLNEPAAKASNKASALQVVDAKGSNAHDRANRIINVEAFRIHGERIILKCVPRNKERFDRLLQSKPLLPAKEKSNENTIEK